MVEYLTEAAYQRWYRQYQASIIYYLNTLDQLRIRLDSLPLEEVEAIQKLLDQIDENFEKIIPRDFAVDGKPLKGFEKFLENIKVLINLIFRVKGKGDYYLGIYQEEKNNVLNAYQEFKFKDKLKKALEMTLAAETKYQAEQVDMVAATMQNS